MRADIGLFDLMYMKGDITQGQYIGIMAVIVIVTVTIGLIANRRH